MKKILALCFVLPLLLAGCSGPSYEDFDFVQPSSPNNAVLYVYRPKSSNRGVQPLGNSYPEVFLGEQSIGLLKYKTHLVYEAPAGRYELKATGLTNDAAWKQHDIVQNITLKPGETRFMKLTIEYAMKEMSILDAGAKYQIFLTPVDASSANYEIRDTSPAK